MFSVQEGGFKIFLCGTRDEKIILRFSTPAKKNVPGSGVWRLCGIRAPRLMFFFY